jgi:hypothetical protein
MHSIRIHSGWRQNMRACAFLPRTALLLLCAGDADQPRARFVMKTLGTCAGCAVLPLVLYCRVWQWQAVRHCVWQWQEARQ